MHLRCMYVGIVCRCGCAGCGSLHRAYTWGYKEVGVWVSVVYMSIDVGMEMWRERSMGMGEQEISVYVWGMDVECTEVHGYEDMCVGGIIHVGSIWSGRGTCVCERQSVDVDVGAYMFTVICVHLWGT